MAVEFKWDIVQLETKPQEGELTDVVACVHWIRSASEGIYYAESRGSMGCASPSSTDFTAYPDLTKEQVEAWLDSGLDVFSIDNDLVNVIDNQKNPPIVILPLPWGNTES